MNPHACQAPSLASVWQTWRALGCQYHKHIAAYLKKYAHPKMQAAAKLCCSFSFASTHPLPAKTLHPTATWVIPAHKEGDAIAASLEAIAQASLNLGWDSHIFVVVNQPPSACKEVQKADQHTLSWLKHAFGASGLLQKRYPHVRISPIPCVAGALGGIQKGVGEARRLGMDVALYAMHQGLLPFGPLFGTDADAQISVDTLAAPALHAPKAAAWTYPYGHSFPKDLTPKQQASVANYERWLRHYVTGLHRAGSPYAYPSIGSAMAVAPWAYACVRGMPMRPAGEDFHLLAKIAKMGPIACIEGGSPIEVMPRWELRTPVGTAAALQQATGSFDKTWAPDKTRAHGPKFYPQNAFCALAATLDAMQTLAHNPTCTWHAALSQAWQNHCTQNSASRIQNQTMAPLCAAHDFLGTTNAIPALLAGAKSPALRLRRLHTWLDPLRTLRLIRHMSGYGHNQPSYRSSDRSHNPPQDGSTRGFILDPIQAMRSLQRMRRSDGIVWEPQNPIAIPVAIKVRWCGLAAKA